MQRDFGAYVINLVPAARRRRCLLRRKHAPPPFPIKGSSCFEDEGKGMGTRQVYEEKLRNGNLQHDPTMSPGLGSARCPRCLSLINPNPEKGGWAITSVLHDAASVAGSGAGGLLSAVHSMNSGTSAVFGAYLLPAFSQLSVSSYYAASSASCYAISRATNYIEESHLSQCSRKG
ncbi:uncharacterized protein LOC121998541 isoform X3 [Zingiber officinale]|uniref:uncharacterized protein LOC121998541 isoform X3 n=1 Tax=Zingiber officinale TaxID=94328 RepID=UPI001C4CE837|nr:uncharacterized protein LOC121998541 isoform X3 [Zingiber officinale]